MTSMTRITQEQLDAVLAAHPALNYYGGRRGRDHTDEEFGHLGERLAAALAEVTRCARWLAPLERCGWGKAKSSSYGLKHRVEESCFATCTGPDGCDCYVSNGSLIAAALVLGIAVEPGVLNPRIGVKA